MLYLLCVCLYEVPQLHLVKMNFFFLRNSKYFTIENTFVSSLCVRAEHEMCNNLLLIKIIEFSSLFQEIYIATAHCSVNYKLVYLDLLNYFTIHLALNELTQSLCTLYTNAIR